jgi:hypothetical protein
MPFSFEKLVSNYFAFLLSVTALYLFDIAQNNYPFFPYRDIEIFLNLLTWKDSNAFITRKKTNKLMENISKRFA